VAALAVAALMAGCGVTPPSTTEIAANTVQRYVNALAAGYYTKACTVLDTHARESLSGPTGSRASCKTVLARCLPYNATVAKRDQSQLLYATVQVRIDHAKAKADVSGTTVARAIKQVTLAKERGSWTLTSYGAALRGCVARVKTKLIHG
jgi:hypothetical protein